MHKIKHMAWNFQFWPMFRKSYLEIQASKLDDIGLFGKGKWRSATVMLVLWPILTWIMVKKSDEVDWFCDFHTVLKILLSMRNFIQTSMAYNSKMVDFLGFDPIVQLCSILDTLQFGLWIAKIGCLVWKLWLGKVGKKPWFFQNT